MCIRDRSSPITRRGIINAASLALAAPLAIDAAHDLGFITGDEDLPADLPAVGANEAVAVFAGGCFWCMTAPFETLDGVRAELFRVVSDAASWATGACLSLEDPLFDAPCRRASIRPGGLTRRALFGSRQRIHKPSRKRISFQTV